MGFGEVKLDSAKVLNLQTLLPIPMWKKKIKAIQISEVWYVNTRA